METLKVAIMTTSIFVFTNLEVVTIAVFTVSTAWGELVRLAWSSLPPEAAVSCNCREVPVPLQSDTILRLCFSVFPFPAGTYTNSKASSPRAFENQCLRVKDFV